MFTPEETEHWTLMACPDYEARIMDWLDGELSAVERKSLENHVGGCAACRDFAEELKSLDAVLTSTIRRPILPENFKSKILGRVDREFSTRHSDAAITQLKRAEEAEFQALRAELPKLVLRANLALGLDALGYLGIAAIAWLLLDYALANLPAISALLPSSISQNPAQFLALAFSAACVGAGLAFGMKRVVQDVPRLF
ncbi:MAG: anti-sigma factor [Verrucomicrobiota bacterium]